jgi:hypothetical protein
MKDGEDVVFDWASAQPRASSRPRHIHYRLPIVTICSRSCLIALGVDVIRVASRRSSRRRNGRPHRKYPNFDVNRQRARHARGGRRREVRAASTPQRTAATSGFFSMRPHGCANFLRPSRLHCEKPGPRPWRIDGTAGRGLLDGTGGAANGIPRHGRVRRSEPRNAGQRSARRFPGPHAGGGFPPGIVESPHNDYPGRKAV